jgi:hypothetical protein
MIRYSNFAYALGFAAATLALVQEAPAMPLDAPPDAAATPAAQATPAFRFVYRATPSPGVTPLPLPGAPGIIEIDLSDSTIKTPGDIAVRVVTTPEVRSVTAETFGRTLEIPQVSRGIFGAAYSLPSVPAFFRDRTYDVDVVATVSDGRTATVTLPMTLK